MHVAPCNCQGVHYTHRFHVPFPVDLHSRAQHLFKERGTVLEYQSSAKLYLDQVEKAFGVGSILSLISRDLSCRSSASAIRFCCHMNEPMSSRISVRLRFHSPYNYSYRSMVCKYRSFVFSLKHLALIVHTRSLFGCKLAAWTFLPAVPLSGAFDGLLLVLCSLFQTAFCEI